MNAQTCLRFSGKSSRSRFVHDRVLPIMDSAARTAKLDTEWLVIIKGTVVTWVVMN